MNESPEPAPMLLDPSNTLLWTDIETFGLDYLDDPMLEVGFVVTDLDLNVLHECAWLVWENYYDQEIERLQEKAEKGDEGSKIVLDMHEKSGLFNDARENGDDLDRTEDDIFKWFDEIGLPPGLPMIGSTVGFDRAFLFFNLRKVFNYTHYRVIDVSSLKELAKRYAPEVAEGTKALPKEGKHRTLEDIADSISEFKHYKELFLKVVEK